VVAKVPVEIVTVGEPALESILAAIQLANAEQSEFAFAQAPPSISAPLQIHTYKRARTTELLDLVERTRSESRGFHPFIIVATDAELAGEKFSNLFGSHRAEKGLAILTTALVPDVIIPADRMVAYFIYYLARYSLSFLAPEHKNHDEPRDCVFDRKIAKKDIVNSMQGRGLCDGCRRILVNGPGTFSAAQFDAIAKLLALSGRILRDGQRDGRPRIFIGSSSEGLDIANKLQELLSSEFSVEVWNQGSVFGLGSTTLEALEAAVFGYHFAVFVFTPDDELQSRGEVKPVARDNVLFELGMFIGKLGRKKAFTIHPGKKAVSLPSDLNGVTTAPYEPTEKNLAAALGPVANRIRTAIRQG
jgi:Predicted nucleotide-binding protein containing TIR-like domain